jgi:hypothetical protein
LLKTLLLAALVPEVESLKALTGARLAALNHGTFRAPIPGQEAQQVMRKIRDWAGEVGEIKVTDDTNALVSIQITGVDLEPVLQAAASSDNSGNRKKKIRELLFEQLGVEDQGQLFLEYQFQWRGTPRTVELLYENVRELADDRLRGRPGAWTLVLDFPFDEPNRTPADDIARLQQYRGGDTPTLVWLPSFLSQKALNDLGRYVILDYILQGERFDQYATHLTAIDRAQARSLARNQRDSLSIKLRGHLDVAYGVASGQRDVLSHVVSPDQQFRSLDPTFSPRPPVGADIKSAFEDLLRQLFAHQYPAHPEFDTEIKVSVVKKVWQEVRNAVQAEGQRGLVSDAATRRLVRSIVNPLKLGQMGETHLLVEPHWQSHFTQRMAQEPASSVTVGRLRKLIDQPRPMGLPLELQNLLILAYAAQTNRRLVFAGVSEPDVDRLQDEIELREQTLPGDADWQKAVQRGASVFGLVIPVSLNAANVGSLVVKIREKVSQQRESVAGLVKAVTDRAARYAQGPAGDRQRTAESAQALLAALAAANDQTLVATFSAATIETTEAAAAKAIAQAQQVVNALTNARWELFDAVRGLADQRQTAGQHIVDRLAELLRNDEHVIPLQTKLNELERDAISLLSSGTPVPPPMPPVTTPASPPLPAGKVLVEEIDKIDLNTAAATAVLDKLKSRLLGDPELELTLHYRLHRKSRPN